MSKLNCTGKNSKRKHLNQRPQSLHNRPTDQLPKTAERGVALRSLSRRNSFCSVLLAVRRVSSPYHHCDIARDSLKRNALTRENYKLKLLNLKLERGTAAHRSSFVIVCISIFCTNFYRKRIDWKGHRLKLKVDMFFVYLNNETKLRTTIVKYS